MSTPVQLQANQANAEKSTGPNTAAGKLRSALNSLQHGLSSKVFMVLDDENEADYQDMRNALVCEYRPETITEKILVEGMAQHHWLRTRAVGRLNRRLNEALNGNVPLATLQLWMRYETMHERAFHKCLADLLKLRSERAKSQIGFVLKTYSAEVHALKVEHQELRNKILKSRLPATETPQKDKMPEGQTKKAA